MKSIVISFLLGSSMVLAQSEDLHLTENIFQIEALTEQIFIDFIEVEIPDSQFIFVGEQHGIKEVGHFTNAVYRLANSHGYKTLCVETDAVLADKLAQIASMKEPLVAATKLNQAFPFAIPFYNSKDDYPLFKNVVDTGGRIWGIDQTFMAQFRLNFDHLIQTTENTSLKDKLIPLKQKALDAYIQSIAQKSFETMFWTNYDRTTHDALVSLSTNAQEKEILNQLWRSKEIYGYNNTKEYYRNNQERGQLMKANFNRYYKEALKQTKVPKVLFKLGATHATRGLSMTNIYDVSNYASELAILNDKKSLHLFVAGITGEAMIGNPFAENPTAPFDNRKQLPKELQELVPTFTKKFAIIHLAPLRKYSYGKRYSAALKKLIFNFDVIVLVTDAEPLTPLESTF